MLGAEEFAKFLSRRLAGGGVLRDRSQRCCTSEIARGFWRKGTKLATIPGPILSSPNSLTDA